MSEFIFLIIGLIAGGICGMTTMCLLQVNQLKDIHFEGEENLYDEEDS